MRFFKAIILFSVFSLLAAQNPYGVISIANIAALSGESFTPFPTIDVRGYHTDNDGGGGRFNQEGTSCTPDGGTIFKDSSGNCFIRQLDGRMISNKWFGTYGDNSHDDTTALQNWLNYLTSNANSSKYAGYWDTGSYKILSTLTANGNSGLPNLFTSGAVGLYCSGVGNNPGISVSGGSGGFENVTWQGVFVDCGTAATNEGLRVDGAGFTTFKQWTFRNVGIGLRFYNLSSGSFTEGVVCEQCEFDSTVTTALRYSVGSGTNSFRSSGLFHSTINTGSSNAGPYIIVDSGAYPYFAPLDFTVWPSPGSGTNTLISVRNQTPTALFYGQITVEYAATSTLVFGDTAAYGFGYQGNFMINGGLTSSVNNSLGALSRVKDCIVDSNSATICALQDTNSAYTVTSTGQTISIPTAAPTASTFTQVTLSVVANNYYWQGHYDVFVNGISGNISQVTATSTDLINNTTGWGAPTVSFSGANITITNASWTNSTSVSFTGVYPGQVIPIGVH